MTGRPADRTGDTKPAQSGSSFTTHQFGWDPFERVRLAWRIDRTARRKALLGGAMVATLALVGLTMVGAGSADRSATASSIADRETRLAQLDADLQRRQAQVADLERRRAALENEVGDDMKRVAELSSRREDLQRQVAELTAPIAPSGEDTKTTGEVDDRSPPPDESLASNEPIGARSRASDDESAPSTADVDRRIVAEAEAPPPVVRAERLSALDARRVFIHVRSTDPVALERARAVAADLTRRGVFVEIRGVGRPVRRDAVRYFYDADRDAVAILQKAVRAASAPSDPTPQSQDFRSYGAAPRPGTLELWLS